MGRPKHELELGGRSFLALAIAALSSCCEDVLTVGRDPRWDLQDAAGMVGPAAGIVAALDHDPVVEWLIIACDQPLLERLPAWILEHSSPGATATLLSSGGRRNPFPGLYRAAAREALAAIAEAGSRLTSLADREGVELITAPDELAFELVNVNRPADLQDLASSAS